MSQIKSKNTKSTELKLVEIFKDNHVTGWRRTYPMVGKPDFVFVKQRIAIFVDGCFWHGHDCRNVTPKDNADYWRDKIRRNIDRDNMVTEAIIKKGWSVIRIWECELKGKIPCSKIIDLIEKIKVLKEKK
ncbi:very short patch repair endonuclease [Chryseobacterium sp.]|uniref:very short patch repair endonuclease n=1 Tax=Chryseobacterium sp. TaxID=1871047 RepID=UPI002FC9C240